MKLYSFSKSSWHVRFFEWLFNENPTYRYKTMCPYFWTYVLIVLFLPLILVVKLFGNAGTRFLSWMKDYRHNRIERIKGNFIMNCCHPNLTPKEAYKLTQSKCWDEYRYYLEYEVEEKVKQLARIELNKIEDEQAEAYKKQQERKRALAEQFDDINNKMSTMRENKLFTYFSYVVVGVICSITLYFLYTLVMMIPFYMIDWPVVGYYSLYITLLLISMFGLVLLFYGLIKYVFTPFFKWLSCIKLPSCGICNTMSPLLNKMKYVLYIFLPIWWLVLGIGKLFAIIGHMIYSTYKKSCPMIEWKD